MSRRLRPSLCASRSGRSDPFGPLGDPRTIRLPEEIEEEIRRRAAREDMGVSEYIRILLIGHVAGAEGVRSVYESRAMRVLGTYAHRPRKGTGGDED